MNKTPLKKSKKKPTLEVKLEKKCLIKDVLKKKRTQLKKFKKNKENKTSIPSTTD